MYQPALWAKALRFVVIRREHVEEEPEQLTLWKLGRYHYQVVVTNLRWAPLRVWCFYNQRARIEQLFRALKGEYALGAIPTQHDLANEAYMHLLFLADNLVNWCKRLCVPPTLARARLERLRHTLFHVPSILTKSHHRYRLTVGGPPSTQASWNYAVQRLDALKP